VASAAWAAVLTLAFLVEFVGSGGSRALGLLTDAPLRSTLELPGAAAADRYLGVRVARRERVVGVKVFAPLGMYHPRVRRAAELLARLGFDVAVPTIPGLTAARLRPADVEPVVSALAVRPGPAVVVGVSLGAGPALLAAADSRVRDRVAVVLALGGYASASELVRYFLTGRYGFGDIEGRAVHDPAAVQTFIDANADLLDARVRRALAAEDTAALEALLASPPAPLGTVLDALSPLGVVGELRGRLVLVHGRADPAVPFTESLRLAAARPDGTTVVLVGLLDHVAASPAARWWARLRDLAAMWAALYPIAAGP
jgi:pimeloyl-ACP methyl ester carboxylesterase